MVFVSACVMAGVRLEAVVPGSVDSGVDCIWSGSCLLSQISVPPCPLSLAEE